MQYNASLTEKQERSPRLAKLLAHILNPIDRIFDWAYGSTWNPLYRSGTLACGLLLFVLVTGVYLLFVYRLSAPYESMQAIQSDVFLGRWIRALHRYASDASVVAVIFHTMRMLIEGKTWGPRVLAWISGVVMLGGLLFSGWTGFILVWDRHGQEIAMAGARFVDIYPLLPSPLGRAFSGASTIGSSFFFMNLFLHVALPLGMILAMWIHTKRLSRSVWMPVRPILYTSLATFFIFSIFVPAPLAKQADVYAIGGKFPLDWFYSFWVPMGWYVSPSWVAVFFIFFFGILLSIPLWWKSPKELSKSQNDELRCTGCSKCSVDCPFEAIRMVPRTKGTGSEFVSSINVDLCVSCGICSGSCSQFAIGPAGRSGRDQLSFLKSFQSNLETKDGKKSGIALLHCMNNPSDNLIVEDLKSLAPRVVPCAIECVGTVHPGVVTSLLKYFEGVFFIGCPPRLCQFREGHQVANTRMFDEKDSELPANTDRGRIFIAHGTSVDRAALKKEFQSFAKAVSNNGAPVTAIQAEPKKVYWWRMILVSFISLGFVAFGSRFEAGRDVPNSFLRLSWSLPGQVYESCRDISIEEQSKVPMHMRKTKECNLQVLSYHLLAEVDGKVALERVLSPKGARSDRPIYMDALLPVSPGKHNVKIHFSPIKESIQADGGAMKALTLEYSEEITFEMGRAVLIGFNTVSQKLFQKNN